MKITEIEDRVNDDLRKYVGNFEFCLYNTDTRDTCLELNGNKQYVGSYPSDFFESLLAFISRECYSALRYKRDLGSFGYIIKGTVYCESKNE